MEPCKYILAGEESSDNLRLSQILKQAYGKDNVVRFLDLQSVEPFLINHPANPVIVCLDLFSFGFREVTDFIGYVRNNYPKVVFNLYVDHQEKPIIPILYRNVAQLPFELATLQFIDFTKEDRMKSYSSLFRALSRT
jgi:hypothetical protein